MSRRCLGLLLSLASFPQSPEVVHILEVAWDWRENCKKCFVTDVTVTDDWSLKDYCGSFHKQFTFVSS